MDIHKLTSVNETNEAEIKNFLSADIEEMNLQELRKRKEIIENLKPLVSWPKELYYKLIECLETTINQIHETRRTY